MSVRHHRRPAGLGPPLGRYSHVTVATGGDTVYVAGQVGMTEDGALYGDGGFGDQLRGAFANLGTALAAIGGSVADVAKTTTYLVGGGTHLDEFMEVRGEIFGSIFPEGRFPANTLLFVERLVEQPLLVEVEATAVVQGAAAIEATDA